MFNTIRKLAMLAAVGCLLVAPNQTSAQTTAPAATSAAALSPEQRRWLECIKPLLEASDQRFKKANESYWRTRGFVVDCYTDQRVRVFIADATSAAAKAEYGSNPAAWKRSMRQRFFDCLFSAPKYKEIVSAELKRVEGELAAIDDATLVRLGIDMEFAAVTTTVKPIDFDEVDRLVEDAMALIIPDFEKAYTEQANRESIAADVGTLVGVAAESAMTDENGDVSWAATIGSLFLDTGAQQVGKAILEEQSTTHADLHVCVGLATTNLVLGCADLERPTTKHEIARFQNLATKHHVALGYAVIKELGVDAQWAIDAFNAANAQRAKSSK